MKNNYIHDILSTQLKENKIFLSLEQAEKQFKTAQDNLRRTINYQAIQTILGLKGWSDYQCINVLDLIKLKFASTVAKS